MKKEKTLKYWEIIVIATAPASWADKYKNL